jgi:hypothetical protein
LGRNGRVQWPDGIADHRNEWLRNHRATARFPIAAGSVSKPKMTESANEAAALDEFLQAELAGVDLEGISLGSVAVVRWRSALQSRLRAIAEKNGLDAPSVSD